MRSSSYKPRRAAETRRKRGELAFCRRLWTELLRAAPSGLLLAFARTRVGTPRPRLLLAAAQVLPQGRRQPLARARI